MLASRLLVSIILLPIGLLGISAGGLSYLLIVLLLLGLAAWEYARLFSHGGAQPSMILTILGTLVLIVGRAWDGFASAPWIASLLILSSMTYHLIAYERGRDQAGTDFAITLSGIFYCGWIGAYLISLRDLPEGKWWVLVILPAIWLADTGAFSIGRRYGRHKLSPRLSPKKSWEGYLAGLVTGTLGAVLMALVWRIGAGPDTAVTVGRAAMLGFILSAVTPLGDLGESMIKRQVGAKDSSNLIPGHGGVFDRVDSWLWAGVIGYYLIVWLF
jgi:phosphatidate cytidylyltransferase